MTDIKMPYMDGMELAGRIKEEFPATKLLIFTGFDEFESVSYTHLDVYKRQGEDRGTGGGRGREEEGIREKEYGTD